MGSALVQHRPEIRHPWTISSNDQSYGDRRLNDAVDAADDDLNKFHDQRETDHSGTIATDTPPGGSAEPRSSRLLNR
jgi:hypothetical protein